MFAYAVFSDILRRVPVQRSRPQAKMSFVPSLYDLPLPDQCLLSCGRCCFEVSVVLLAKIWELLSGYLGFFGNTYCSLPSLYYVLGIVCTGTTA